MKILFLSVYLVLAALAAQAAPQAYRLDREGSRLGFEWRFGNDPVTGEMPVTSARVVIDFAALEASSLRVRADASRARAGFPFATQAIRGPKMFDAANHPGIIFESTRVRRDGNGAVIDGVLTIRGVTRPARLTARIYRRPGSAADDLSTLEVHLSGAVSRAAFGADGWAGLVADRVVLKIVARLRAAP